MNAGLGGGIADHADRLARAFPRAGVCLCPLSAYRQAAQVTDTAITLDALQPLQVHADLAAQVALDNIFPILDRVNNLRELLLGQIFGADARVDVRVSKDLPRVGRADAIDRAQGDFDAFVGRNFDSNNTSHVLL